MLARLGPARHAPEHSPRARTPVVARVASRVALRMRTTSRDGNWLVPAFTGFIGGTALQLTQPSLWEPWRYAALAVAAVLTAVVAFRRRDGGRLRGPVAFAVAASLAFCTCGWRSAEYAAGALAPAMEGRPVRVAGVVAAMPERTATGPRFRLEVEEAAVDGHAVVVPSQLALGWYGEETQGATPDIRAGERWRITVKLKAPHGSVNPRGFDYELWLWEQGLGATGYVRAGPNDAAPERLAATWNHPVESARQAVRDAIFENVADRRMAGVLAALVVGDQGAIERADWDIFRATGVAHLMSISGVHVTMFAWLAAAFVGAAWRRSASACLAWPAQHAGVAGGVALATAYAMFSGWGVPSQRTIIMLAAVGLLRLSGRTWPWPAVWLLACAVVVACDPWALLQAGFWLSFVAVGVLFAADPGRASAVPETRRGRFVAGLRAAAHEQWVVTLALTPLTLLLFGQVSVVGLAANALSIPWVTLVVTPLAMAGVAFHPVWTAAALAVGLLATVLEWLAAVPHAVLVRPQAPAWAAAAGVFGGLLLAMRLPPAARALGIPLLVPVLCWQVPRPAAGEFELLFTDVGQGNAVLLRTGTHALVYDSGPRFGPESDAGHRVLVPLLRSLGEEVDLLLLSHRDSDHTGGAAAILSMQPKAALLSSIEATHELQSLRRSTRCEAGQAWEWDGVKFSILHPGAGDYVPAAKPNTLSCVLRVDGKGGTALLAGDLERPQEKRLVDAAAPLRADVLLVPHHGSKTSSGGSFLDAVKPGLAVVQSGYRNRFGHPAPPVMARYAERGIRVVDSPHCGAAAWRSAQPRDVACERDLEPRYWRHAVP